MRESGQSTTTRTEAPLLRPTWVRWRIVGLMMAISFMTWFNRVSMSAAYDDAIRIQYPTISKEAIGTVYSAFILVYALFMTPGGWFIDRFGPWTALVIMGFGSALFGALTGSVGVGIFAVGMMVPTFLVIRSLMGLFTAPVYPACGRMVANWIPLRQRAWANGLINGAAPIGMACTYIGFGALMDWFGWPSAFMITGILTALVTVLWTLYARNRPAEHRSANLSERRLIADDRPAVVPDQHPPIGSPIIVGSELERLAESTAGDGNVPTGWRALLGNRSLVFLTLSYAAVGYFEYIFNFWMHYYMEEVKHLGKSESRYYATILFLAQAAGMFLGGWLSDRLKRRYGYRLGRAIVPVGGMLGSAVFLILGLWPSEPGWIVFWFSLAMIAVGSCEGPFWATAIELGGRKGGASAGICNTGGNVGGLLSPVVTPWVSDLCGWTWGISLGSLVCVIGAALWWWIDPAQRVTDSESAKASNANHAN